MLRRYVTKAHVNFLTEYATTLRRLKLREWGLRLTPSGVPFIPRIWCCFMGKSLQKPECQSSSWIVQLQINPCCLKIPFIYSPVYYYLIPLWLLSHWPLPHPWHFGLYYASFFIHSVQGMCNKDVISLSVCLSKRFSCEATQRISLEISAEGLYWNVKKFLFRTAHIYIYVT